MWLIPRFPRPVRGLKSARSNYPSLTLRVLDKRWWIHSVRKRSTCETSLILPRALRRRSFSAYSASSQPGAFFIRPAFIHPPAPTPRPTPLTPLPPPPSPPPSPPSPPPPP